MLVVAHCKYKIVVSIIWTWWHLRNWWHIAKLKLAVQWIRTRGHLWNDIRYIDMNITGDAVWPVWGSPQLKMQRGQRVTWNKSYDNRYWYGRYRFLQVPYWMLITKPTNFRVSRFRHVSQCTVEKSLNEYLTATQALTFDPSPAVYQLTSNLLPATSRGLRAACSRDQSTVTYRGIKGA